MKKKFILIEINKKIYYVIIYLNLLKLFDFANYIYFIFKGKTYLN